MIFIKSNWKDKIYTIKYYQSPLLLSVTFSDLWDNGYEEITQHQLSKMIFPLLLVDSFDLFPMDIIKDCTIRFLELNTHFEMDNENFKILNGLTNDIDFLYQGYVEWFQTEKRMATIKNITE